MGSELSDEFGIANPTRKEENGTLRVLSKTIDLLQFQGLGIVSTGSLSLKVRG